MTLFSCNQMFIKKLFIFMTASYSPVPWELAMISNHGHSANTLHSYILTTINDDLCLIGPAERERARLIPADTRR